MISGEARRRFEMEFKEIIFHLFMTNFNPTKFEAVGK